MPSKSTPPAAKQFTGKRPAWAFQRWKSIIYHGQKPGEHDVEVAYGKVLPADNFIVRSGYVTGPNEGVGFTLYAGPDETEAKRVFNQFNKI